MHKKSLEASKKMSEEDENLSDLESGQSGGEVQGRVKEERKSESIAALRARAVEHSVKVMQGLGSDEDSKVISTADDSGRGVERSNSHDVRSNSQDVKRHELMMTISRNMNMCS